MNFEEIPEISERIKRSKMELQDNGLYWAPEWDSQSCSDQDFVNNFRKGWLARQAEIDHLSSVLEERTKEWLKAIELGDYFKNVAKPLRAEIDQLQSQINDMAEVGLNQEKALMVKNKQIELVKEVLQGLKDELGDLVEMDLYDKGYRVCSKYVIDDLEQALGGAQ